MPACILSKIIYHYSLYLAVLIDDKSNSRSYAVESCLMFEYSDTVTILLYDSHTEYSSTSNSFSGHLYKSTH